MVAIPTISLSIFFVKWIYDDTTNAAMTELEYQVTTVSENTARDIRQIISRLSNLSNNADVLEGLVKSPIGLRNTASFQAIEYVKQTVKKHQLLAASYLIDTDLELVGGFPETIEEIPKGVISRLSAVRRWYEGERQKNYVEIFKIHDKDLFDKVHKITNQEMANSSLNAEKVERGLGIMVGIYDYDNEEYRGTLFAVVPFENILGLASQQIKNPAYLTIASEGFTIGSRHVDDHGDTITMMSKLNIENPISNNDLNIQISIFEPYENRFESANHLLKVLIVTIATMILFTVGLTYYFTIKISMPLAKLNDIVADFTLGKYDTVTENMAFKEFRRFLNTLNSMGKSIKNKIHKLETLSETSQKISGITDKNVVVKEVLQVAMNRLSAHSATVVLKNKKMDAHQTLVSINGNEKVTNAALDSDIYREIVENCLEVREDRFEYLCLPTNINLVLIIKTFGDSELGVYSFVFFGEATKINYSTDGKSFLSTLSRMTVARLKHIHMLELIEEQNLTLEKNVALRTEELATRNREMQSILANMKQGIFTIDEDKIIQPEYSLYLEDIFGRTDFAGRNAINILFGKSHCADDLVEQVNEVINVSIGEYGFCFELNCHLLVYDIIIELEPGKLKYLELDWEKIENESGIIEKVLVVVKDVTKLKALEEKSSKSTEQLDVFNRIIEIGIDRFEGMVLELENLLSRADEVFHQNLDQKFPQSSTILNSSSI
ncbi:MAG: hypothetical protein HRU09_19165 [Oligoflexales bacterium]|nr:hypothetical protein [Oligoflexales bacterium]